MGQLLLHALSRVIVKRVFDMRFEIKLVASVI